jgi:hypothetical protein
LKSFTRAKEASGERTTVAGPLSPALVPMPSAKPEDPVADPANVLTALDEMITLRMALLNESATRAKSPETLIDEGLLNFRFVPTPLT